MFNRVSSEQLRVGWTHSAMRNRRVCTAVPSAAIPSRRREFVSGRSSAYTHHSLFRRCIRAHLSNRLLLRDPWDLGG